MSVHYVPAKRPPTPDILGNVLEAKVERELIPLNKVRSDGGTQMRAALNEDTVKEYEEKFGASHAWGDFPPVVLFFDGTDYWVGDGFHRIEAYRRAIGGNLDTTPVHADVRAGSRRDAILYAAGANANHGLRRTNQDKRRSVEVLLRDPEWAKWSDGEIARRCAVSDRFVASLRKELSPNGSEMPTERTVTRGGQTYTQNTANIGANQPQYAEVWRLQHVVQEVFERFYDADDLRHACSDMRAAARTRMGGFWVTCERSMPDDIKDYRKSDLVQAINNLAAQKEVQLTSTNSSAGAALDPWAIAVNMAGSRQSRSEAVARAMMPWIREYRDTYGRNWQDLALHGNPSHSNSTFWQDIGKELKLRAVTVDDDTLKLAIKQAFSWLSAEEPAEDTAQPVIGLDDLAVVDSVAGPTGWTDPEPESDLDSYDDESATLAARRMNKLHTLKVRFGETIDLLDEFGDLTGRHIATLAVGRELANLIDILEAEMDGLQKGINNHA